MKNTVGMTIEVLDLVMTSRLIGSGQSNRLSNPVRPKMMCCTSLEYFGCQVKNYSATRNLSRSILSHHQEPTGGFVEGILSIFSYIFGVFDRPSRQSGSHRLMRSYVCVYCNSLSLSKVLNLVLQNTILGH